MMTTFAAPGCASHESLVSVVEKGEHYLDEVDDRESESQLAVVVTRRIRLYSIREIVLATIAGAYP